MSVTYQIRKEPSGTSYRDQILNMVRSRRDVSEQSTQAFRQKLPKWYDLWRGLATGTFTPTKNNLHVPLIYSTIWSDVARKIATAYAQWPILSFSGHGPDDSPVARKQEALVNAQLRDADVLSKEINTFLSADLYGTAISQVMWDHREETRNSTDFRALPLSGDVVRQLQRQRLVTFDGPNYRPIDLLDFFPQPGYREINGNLGMQWSIVRYYLDLDQCRFLASEQGGRIFDAQEVERMVRDSAVSSPRSTVATNRRLENRVGLSPHIATGDRFTRPVEILEMWGTIPTELAGPFGSTNVVISLANDNYILRAMETPFAHRQKPFVKYSPTPDPHYFFAPGKAEVAHQMQIAGNRFLNHQLDAADLLVHPMWIYHRDRMLNTRNLVAGPGRIFGVTGSGPLTESLQTVPMDMRGLQVGGQMTETLWRFIQMGSGVQEDTIMGGGGMGSDRQTAREFLGRREASGTRLMLESVIYDGTYLEPLGDMFASLNRQFLELPREVLILGDSAQNDPVTGEPIQNSRVGISGLDLVREYAAQANGTTMSLSRETQKANMMTILQIVASGSPAFAGSFVMVNFLRQLLKDLGFKNVNELVQRQPSVAEALAQNGMDSASQMPSSDQGLLQMAGGGMPSGPMGGIPQ